jgi:hypothetical protein
LTQLIHIAGQMHHAEMVIQRFRQHFRSFAVALRDNYTERFHEMFPHWLRENTLGCFRLDFYAAGFPQAVGELIS